jgi:hypothetical protein
MYHPIFMIEFKLHCHWQIELAAEKRSRAAEGRYRDVPVTGHLAACRSLSDSEAAAAALPVAPCQ